MKKLFYKNKKLRNIYRKLNKKYFILKLIIKNKHIFVLNRFKAIYFLKVLLKNKYFFSMILNYCLYNFNKIKFNKYTYYSRQIFLKKLQNTEITGFKRANW